ncbi:hypothetical protein L9F63_007413 [Diploptera punctata]|uniref:Cytochrome P450 n=1 Tax=Diploptera punctata TaxID=6984 RepID=A0AAD7Z8P9_DIPPU|nr:hypothetical protein L9F63_007413 [Diploptera punctata]
MNIIIVLLCVLVITAILSWKWGRYYLGFKLPGPPALPLIGNLLDVRSRDFTVLFHEMNKYIKNHGPVTRIWLGPVMLIFVSGPEEIAKVVGNDKIGHRGKYSLRILSPIFNKGLLAQEEMSVWKIHRKIVTNAFHNNMLNKFVDNFAKNSNILANRLKELADGTNAYDILPYLCLCALDIITQTCFGQNINAQINNDMMAVQYNKTILDSTQIRLSDPFLMFDWAFYLTEIGKKYKVAVKYYHDLIKGVIDDRAINAKSKEELSKSPTLMDYLIQNGQLSKEEIVGEISSIGGAGTETTATLSTFVLAILAEHQDIQEKVFEEQKTIFGEDILRPVTSDDLPSMTYLEQVINETLRLYPPVIGHPRETIKEYGIGNGYILPVEAQLLICAYPLHRNPEIHPAPDKFDPERFTPENVAARHPYAFVPFGVGRRMCVGYKFAYMETKAILSTILRHFHMMEIKGGLEGIQKNIHCSFVLTVTDGIHLKFKPRKYAILKTQ